MSTMMDAVSPATTTQYYPSQHQAQAQHQHFHPQQPMAQESVCGGCKEPIESESGGVVVSFGDALWHVKCFRCAKCHERVTADTNLLLLSDGSPVCGSCSYNCNVCKLPILDEAIMTGDESYHAGCFTCRSCNKQIQELVFAKTTNGIYCMQCHNERVARSRRHAEQKRSKSKTKGDTASAGSSRPRERERREPSRPPEMPLTPARPAMPGVTAPGGYNHLPAQPTPTSSYMSNTSSNPPSAYPSSANSASPTPGASIQSAHEAFPFPAKRMSAQSIHRVLETANNPQQQSPTQYERGRADTLGMTSSETETEDERRRKSHDDGVRHPNGLLNAASPLMSSASSSSSNQTLQNPTSRADKRKSINPGTGLYQEGPTSSVRSLPMLSASEGRLSPATGGRASYQTIDGVSAPIPKSPGEQSLYYSPSPSPVPHKSNHSSRSASPQPPSVNSAPNLVHSGTTPPTPGLSVHPNRHLGSHLDAFPPRTNSLPNSSLDERDERRRGRSPSPSPRRATDTVPAPVVSGASSDAGMETDGDVVMVPRGSGEGKRDSAPAPPPKSRTSPQEDESDSDGMALIPPPALPPMRFSVNSTDFASLLTSVTDEDGKRSMNDFRVDSPSFDEGDMTVVLSPPDLASRSSSTNGTARGEPLALDMPEESSLTSPPTPPPSSAKSTSSNYSTGANGIPRSNTVPMTLHQSAVLGAAKGRERADSSGSGGLFGSPPTSNSLPTISVSHPGGATPRPQAVRGESGSGTSVDFVQRRLREALKDSNERGSTSVKLDREFVEAIVRALDAGKEKTMDLKGQIDTMKRTSQQYMNGFSVAQSEYHKEVAARRDLEAEVTRLRVQLSGQAARLTAMSAESRRQEMMEQMSRDLSANLGTLEREMSKLQVARDMALAEVDELNTTDGHQSPRSPQDAEEGANMTRSLTVRWDGLKHQYRKELEPLRQQREALVREINELKEARDIFLEETTALNARNEELADLNAQISRQIEVAVSESSVTMDSGSMTDGNLSSYENGSSGKQKSGGGIFGSGRMKTTPTNSPSFSSVNTSITSIDERDEFGRSSTSIRHIPLPSVEPVAAPNKSKFKTWFGATKEKEKKPKLKAHSFQHFNLIRFTRCDHCSDKMWGPQLRCSGCGISCHPRCQSAIQTPCQSGTHSARDDTNVVDIAPLPPSMFGRDLVEQARADAKGADNSVPMIVDKCIDAVELLGMDYEGIYRKTGGSSQSKLITQLFERGDYDAFDLRDSNAFNDICSVTSVLKNYFRALPNPLLTYALHEAFVSAACLKDPREKHTALLTLVAQLPREHYMTLRALMLHLNRVQRRSDENLMNARNLGVVFGPTLMRPSDMSKEFADMAGKALSVEWLVENAPEVFDQSTYS